MSTSSLKASTITIRDDQSVDRLVMRLLHIASTTTLQDMDVDVIRTLLNEIILSDDPRHGFEALTDNGILAAILPELFALYVSDQTSRGLHKLNFEHSMIVLQQAIALESDGPDLTLRLAAVLHDVGKAPTRVFNGRAKVTFDGHEAVGAAMIAKRLRILGYDSVMIHDVTELIRLHMRAHGYEHQNGDHSETWNDAGVRRFIKDAGPLLDRLMIITKADITTIHPNQKKKLIASIDRLEHHMDKVIEEDRLAAIRPELNGHQLADLLGIREGRLLGDAYRHMLNYRMSHGEVGQQAAEAEAIRWFHSLHND
jgi:poly(A) polymerase